MSILNINNDEINKAREREKNTPQTWFWDTIKTWGKEAATWLSQLYKGAVNSVKNSFTDTTPLYDYNAAKQLLNDYDTIKNLPVASLNPKQLGQLADNFSNIKQNLQNMGTVDGIRQRVKNDDEFYLNAPETRPLSVQEAKAKYLKELSLNSVLSQTEQRNRTFVWDGNKSYTYDRSHSNEVAANIFNQFSSKTDPILNTIAELEDVYEKNGNKWDSPQQQKIYDKAMKQWISSVEYIKHVVNHENELQDLWSSVQNFIKRGNWKYVSPFTVEDNTGWSNNEDYYSQALATETFKKGWNQVFWDGPKAKGLLDMTWGGFGALYGGINKHLQNYQTKAVVGWRDLASLATWDSIDDTYTKHNQDIMMGDSNRLRDVNNTLAHDSSFRRSVSYYITDTSADWYDALSSLPKILSAPMSIFKAATKTVDEARDIYKAIDLASDVLKPTEKAIKSFGLADSLPYYVKKAPAALSEEVVSNLSKIAPKLTAPSKLSYGTRKVLTTIAKEIAENFAVNAALNGTSRQDYKPTDLAMDIFTGLFFPGISTMLDIKGYSQLAYLQKNADKYTQAAFNLDDLTWRHIDPNLRHELTNTMLTSVEKNRGKMQQSIDTLKKASRPFEEIKVTAKNIAKKSVQRFLELADKEKRGHILEQKPDKTWTLKKNPETWKAVATFKDYINLQRDVVNSISTGAPVQLSKSLEEIANNIVNFEKLDDKMKANTIRGTIESAWENMMYFFQQWRDKYNIKPAETYDQFYEQLQKWKYHRVMEAYAFDTLMKYNTAKDKGIDNITFEQASSHYNHVYTNGEGFFNKLQNDKTLSSKEKIAILKAGESVESRVWRVVTPQPFGKAYGSAYEMAYFLGTSWEVVVDWTTYKYNVQNIQGGILTFEWVAKWKKPIHFWVDNQYMFHTLDVDSPMDFIKTDWLTVSMEWEIGLFGTHIEPKSTFWDHKIDVSNLTKPNVIDWIFEMDIDDAVARSGLPREVIETFAKYPGDSQSKQYFLKRSLENNTVKIENTQSLPVYKFSLEDLFQHPEDLLDNMEWFYLYQQETIDLLKKAIEARMTSDQKLIQEIKNEYYNLQLAPTEQSLIAIDIKSPLAQEDLKKVLDLNRGLIHNPYNPSRPLGLVLDIETWTVKIIGEDKDRLKEFLWKKWNNPYVYAINPNTKLPKIDIPIPSAQYKELDIPTLYNIAKDITKYGEYHKPYSDLYSEMFNDGYGDYISSHALAPLISADDIPGSTKRVFEKLLEAEGTRKWIFPDNEIKNLRYTTGINLEPFKVSDELIELLRREDIENIDDFFRVIKGKEHLIPEEYLKFVDEWSKTKSVQEVYNQFKQKFERPTVTPSITPKPTTPKPKPASTPIPPELQKKLDKWWIRIEWDSITFDINPNNILDHRFDKLINNSPTLMDIVSESLDDIVDLTDEALKRLEKKGIIFKKSSKSTWLFEGFMYNMGKDKDKILSELSWTESMFWKYEPSVKIEDTPLKVEPTPPKVEPTPVKEVPVSVDTTPVKFESGKSLFEHFWKWTTTDNIHIKSIKEFMWDKGLHKKYYSGSFKTEFDTSTKMGSYMLDLVRTVSGNPELTPAKAYDYLSNELKSFYKELAPININAWTGKPSDWKRWTFVNKDIDENIISAFQGKYNLIFEWPKGLEKIYNLEPIETSPLVKTILGIEQELYSFRYDKPVEITVDWVKKNIDFEEYVHKIINADMDNFITSCPI